MIRFFSIFFLLSSTFQVHGGDELEANHVLRKEALRLAIEDPDQVQVHNVDFSRTLFISQYGGTALGVGAQGTAIYILLGEQEAKNFTRFQRSGLGILSSVNMIAMAYLFAIFGGHDWTPDGPKSAGTLQATMAAGLVTPQVLALIKRRGVFKRKIGWPLHSAVWVGASMFGVRAFQNLTTDSNISQHAQLTPDQFDDSAEKLAQAKIFDDRAYILGIRSPRKIAMLKEHMSEPNWIEKLPYLEDSMGEQIVSDESIQRLNRLSEIVQEQTSEFANEESKKAETPLPDDFFQRERLAYEFLIQKEIERLKEIKGTEGSVKSAERALNRAKLLNGRI